jgi:NAD(P)-dependent dehydrogenase (short-subunit alcohol dehydrogenase family)
MGQITEQKLANKVAVITGGNSGIGLATAREFKAQGASIVITGRDEKTLFDAARELGGDTLAIRADAANLADIDKIVSQVKDRFGRIDVLFVNAGVGNFGPAVEMTEELYDFHMNINVKGLFFTVTKAFPLLQKGGSVIFTGSVLDEKGSPGTSVYSATKAAVRSLARTFAAEFVDAGIRVNTLSPGPIDTPIFGRMGDEKAVVEMKKGLAAGNPMKRMGQPEEIAKAALFLASSDSSFVTGINLKVDGGMGQI